MLLIIVVLVLVFGVGGGYYGHGRLGGRWRRRRRAWNSAGDFAGLLSAGGLSLGRFAVGT
jgi:hypothetical protein